MFWKGFPPTKLAVFFCCPFGFTWLTFEQSNLQVGWMDLDILTTTTRAPTVLTKVPRENKTQVRSKRQYLPLKPIPIVVQEKADHGGRDEAGNVANLTKGKTQAYKGKVLNLAENHCNRSFE